MIQKEHKSLFMSLRETIKCIIAIVTKYFYTRAERDLWGQRGRSAVPHGLLGRLLPDIQQWEPGVYRQLCPKCRRLQVRVQLQEIQEREMHQDRGLS